MSGPMDDTNEDETAHRAWVRWAVGDTGMPVWGVALMHDLVLTFYKEATSE